MPAIEFTAKPARPGRSALHPDFSERLIRRVVYRFYERVRADAELAPIFGRRIAPADWPAHLERMTDFWSSVLLMSGRYKGKPLPAHQRISEARPDHFERWLALFRETVKGECRAEAAAIFIDRAERIAQSLQMAMFYSPGSARPSSPLRGDAK